MDIQRAITHVARGASLSQDEAHSVMLSVMSGECTSAQIGALLTALHIKGETVDELTGATQAMRELSMKVDVTHKHLIDTCGTGGTGKKLFNVSTASAFVAAAAGGKVAKHGNRGMSSSFGSADLLEAAGIALDLTPQQIARCISEVGVGFMFAQAHHSAMRHVAPVRREIGIRTLFNLLGPMTNPAGAKAQLIGVFDGRWARPMVEALRRLGSERVLVVHSNEGLDELSIAGPNQVVELRDGVIREYTLGPAEVGLTASPIAPLQATSVTESLDRVHAALRGEGAAADMVAFNAGAAIYVAGICSTIADGVHMAEDAIASGLADECFDELIRVSKMMKAVQ